MNKIVCTLYKANSSQNIHNLFPRMCYNSIIEKGGIAVIEAAQAMVKCLEAEKTEIVFGYPGAAICPFYDYLSKSSIRHILVRQEQNAGHSAGGYARITGRPAVCIATSGPGATNLLTAIATAHADSVPLIAITGQVSTDQIGSDVFQEADITGAAEPVVKHSLLVRNASDIPMVFKQAFYLAGSGRKGPVLIDMPVDLQKEQIEFSYPESIEIRAYKPTIRGNALQLRRIAEAVATSERPLICAGGGIFGADACEELKALARRTEIPVVTTMMGLGVLRRDDPLFIGMIGMHGSQAANSAVHDCDLLILIGARVGDRAVTAPCFLEETTKIVHIDIDPAEIGKNIATDIPLVGDAKCILKQLLEMIPEMQHKQWLNELSMRNEAPLWDAPLESSDFICPEEFIGILSSLAPENTIIAADVGQTLIWTAKAFAVKNGRFLISGGMGTMGYALPAAIGAKLAAPDTEVIAICGDGAFQMEMMELATMLQHGITVKIIIMNNNRLGMIREIQSKEYGNNQFAVALDGSPDFITLAKAYGIKAERISRISEAREAVRRLLEADEPMLLECIVDSEY